MSKDTAYFCPSCGSPSLEVSGLVGGAASCGVCDWSGKREELAAVPIEHDFQSQEEMILRFIKQLASTFAKSGAIEVGKVLLQWGFLDEKRVQEDLHAYIRAMAVAAAKSVIETRQHLERSRANKARQNDVS